MSIDAHVYCQKLAIFKIAKFSGIELAIFAMIRTLFQTAISDKSCRTGWFKKGGKCGT